MRSEAAKYASMDPEIAEGVRFVQIETQRQLDMVEPGRYEVRLVFGARSYDEQLALYMKGREKHGDLYVVTDRQLVVTNSKPGLSAHNTLTLSDKPFSQAGDLAIIDRAAKKYAPNNFNGWALIPANAFLAPVELESGAFFPGLLDWGHLQRPGWRKLVESGRLRA